VTNDALSGNNEQLLPERLAVDADGYCWRVFKDGSKGLWSMARINPDNSPIPEPVTFYARSDVRPRVRASNAMAHVLPPNPEDGELEHSLIIGDEFSGLMFVGSLTSIQAIADAIYRGIVDLPKDFPTLSRAKTPHRGSA
jgi:hypothetical protein